MKRKGKKRRKILAAKDPLQQVGKKGKNKGKSPTEKEKRENRRGSEEKKKFVRLRHGGNTG